MKRFLTAFLMLLACGSSAAISPIALEINLVGSDTLSVKFTNKGDEKVRINLMDTDYQEFNYGIWIENTEGKKKTACHYCRDNWFYPISTWSSTKLPEREKKISLRPGSSFTQELELHRMVIPLMWEITKDEANQRIKDGDKEFISKLSLIENDFPEVPFVEAVSKRNGPFKLKIRFEGIESNWIQIDEIIFEQNGGHNSGSSAASIVTP